MDWKKEIKNLFEECILYLNFQRENEDSVVYHQNLFNNLEIRGTSLWWEDTEGMWNITFNGIEDGSSINWLTTDFKSWTGTAEFVLSHVQHLTVVMGILTNGIDRLIREDAKK